MSSKRGRFQNRTRRPNKYNDNKPKQRRDYSKQEQLAEEDVGITEYLSNIEGFSAVIKARFSDFQVNEINLEGAIAKLSDLGIPKDFQLKLATCDYREIIDSPSHFISDDKWEDMKKLLETDNGQPVLIEADSFDKNARTEVHTCVKSHFGRKIVASTIEKDGKKFIEIRKFDKECKEDLRTQWPKDKGEYVYFMLYKETMDTMEAILKISDNLKMPSSAFAYAGVKDKRAKTTQWCSVRRVEPWKLLRRNNTERSMKVGNLTFKDTPIMLGQLQGNRFKIALRNVLANNELIDKAMKFIEENGFINYYGLQRFGNDKQVPTYMIGIKLLLGQFKEACELILKPKEAEDPYLGTVKAKKIFAETGDAQKAFDALTKHKCMSLEGRLLEGLKNSNENDYVSALEKVPRYTRLMYMNAFQSLIWNKMVSKRIQLFGLKPVVGDLVLKEKLEAKQENLTEEIEADKPENNETETTEKENDDEELAPPITDKVIVLGETDLSKYTIYDIVLPLPGYGVRYPDHLKEHYKEAVEEFGLTLDMTPHTVKMYSTRGNYRPMLQKLKNVSWKVLMYNDPTDNLIRSDFEELKGQPEPESMELGRYKALIMQFDLSPSCYATMVLRELLKTNTSSSAQAKLNKYHDGKERMISIQSVQKNTTINDDLSSTSPTSLLANKEKYEEFKNSIFKNILTTPKRKIDEEDNGTKKLKVEESL